MLIFNKAGRKKINRRGIIIFDNSITKTNFPDFQQEFQKNVMQMSGPAGYERTNSIVQNFPCGDKIYITDSSRKGILPSLEPLGLNPLIAEHLESGTKSNVFIVKDDKIQHSFFVKDLTIDYPLPYMYKAKIKKDRLQIRRRRRLCLLLSRLQHRGVR